MRKGSKKADLPSVGARSKAKKRNLRADPIKDTCETKKGGEGIGRSQIGEFNKLIRPRKKCDKGANFDPSPEDDWQKIISQAESDKPPFTHMERIRIPENELAWRMGVPRQWLRDLRKKDLTEDIDWHIHGNAVILLHTAIDKILRQLNLDISEIPEKEPPRLFKVAKFWANPRLIGCTDPEPEAVQSIIHTVWVRDSSMFNIHQLIPVVFQKDRWVLGCRQPRTKGKLK